MTANTKEIKIKSRHFSTRDLLMMAALAALGGVTSTYINTLGKLVYSVTGVVGSSQWAAGLHVLWIVLAVGLTGKKGAGTTTGILKGAVELLSGNSHGLVVMLINVTAGLLVDLGFLPFKDKRKRLAYMLAGGLAAASNVFVFQLFAALPAQMVSYGIMLLIGLMAFASGVFFAGSLGETLVRALYRAGVVREQPHAPMSKRATWILYSILIIVTIVFAGYLAITLKGPSSIEITGAVETPTTWKFSRDQELIAREAEQSGVPKSYKGVPLAVVLADATPTFDEGLVLITATDGYAFFISLAEIADNDNLLMVPKGSSRNVSYDVMGAHSPKAWIRDAASMVIVPLDALPIEGALDAAADFDPTMWQFDMDSYTLDVGNGAQKLQGVPLGMVLESMSPTADAQTVVLHGQDGQTYELAYDDVVNNKAICIFTVIGEESITYAIANTDGTVLMADTLRIEVQ